MCKRWTETNGVASGAAFAVGRWQLGDALIWYNKASIKGAIVRDDSRQLGQLSIARRAVQVVWLHPSRMNRPAVAQTLGSSPPSGAQNAGAVGDTILRRD